MSTYTIRVEGTRIIVSEDGVDCCRFATPAAALELAARLREVATSIQQQAVRDAAERLRAAAPITVWAQGNCRWCGKEMRGDGATTAEAHESLAQAIAAHLCPVAPCGCRVNPGWRCQKHGDP